MYLEIKNLSKSISGKSILEHIDLEMDRGRIYGLRGKNGSGKTMLMRSICGLILPTEGTIRINGEILHKDISFPRSIGALIENPGFIAEYSGFKNLSTLASIKKAVTTEEIRSLMQKMELDPDDKKKFKKYSLGMKQKIGIIAAIMEQPELIVLDEPINALDEKSVNIVKELLLEQRKRGALIIISCHDKEELEFLADEVFCLENGKVIDRYLVKNEDV